MSGFLEGLFGEAEALGVAAEVVLATAFEAGDGLADASNTFELSAAVVADIKPVPGDVAALPGQGVPGAFAGDAQLSAGALPFPPVGREPAAGEPPVHDKVGEFMQQSAAHLPLIDLMQFGVEQDHAVMDPSLSGGRLQSRVPVNGDVRMAHGWVKTGQGLLTLAAERLVELPVWWNLEHGASR